MTDYTTPARLAEIDQDRAQLRELTVMVRAHHSAGCPRPEFCSGAEAVYAMPANDPVQMAKLLQLALVELAHTPDPPAWPSVGGPESLS